MSSRRRFLYQASLACLTVLSAGVWGQGLDAAPRDRGEVAVRVYREPRPGVRERQRNKRVTLSNGASAYTDDNGVARFFNLPFGRYEATSMGGRASVQLQDAVLRLDIVVR